MKSIVLLGSAGSVGKNVVDVVRRFTEAYRFAAFSSNNNVESLADQAKEFGPEIIAIGKDKSYSSLKADAPERTKILSGAESLEELASMPGADIVFIAISGTAALKPLIAALKSGKTVALASKEPIVSAGSIIKRVAEEHSSRIIPVDSEHSAVMQCLEGIDWHFQVDFEDL